jgi:hypothetical protein
MPPVSAQVMISGSVLGLQAPARTSDAVVAASFDGMGARTIRRASAEAAPRPGHAQIV